jgi:hypothetical protein
MTDPVSIELIRSVGSAITAIGTIIIGFWVRRLEKNTNSIKDALVEKTETEALARGHLAGRAEQKAEGEKSSEEGSG